MIVSSDERIKLDVELATACRKMLRPNVTFVAYDWIGAAFRTYGPDKEIIHFEYLTREQIVN